MLCVRQQTVKRVYAIISGMEKNNQPLIITAMIVGATLIIALAFIFTRNSDETTPATTAENGASEDGENGNNGNNGNNGQQPTPTPTPTPTPRPTPTPGPTPTPTPIPGPTPTPTPGVLPANWDSLTPQEKIALNPFDCNLETHWVAAEDGRCLINNIDLPELTTLDRVNLPDNPTKADFVALLQPHLTEAARQILQNNTELMEVQTAVDTGVCARHDRDEKTCTGGFYSSKDEKAYTIYKASTRRPHELSTFIHELGHALDDLGDLGDSSGIRKSSEPEPRQALIELRQDPPPDHRIGIAWDPTFGNRACLWTDYRYTLSLPPWLLEYGGHFQWPLSSESLPESVYSELYTEAATLVSPLSAELEEYYSVFFSDRQAIVDIRTAAENAAAYDSQGYGAHSQSQDCDIESPPASRYDTGIPQL